jgi:hypothetical protein
MRKYLIEKLKALRQLFVSGSLPLAECEKRERAAFVAGYKYMRERSEEMKKYPFDEAARITANEEYWRWKRQ